MSKKMNISNLYYKDYFKGSFTARGNTILAHTPFGRFGEADELLGINWKYLLLERGVERDEIVKKNEVLLKKVNAILLESEFQEIPKLDIVNVSDGFELEVAYPGLITGVGIGHESKIEGEFKLGMHFNYTYGMPVVYGSSVKGVLKSYFPHNEKDNEVLQESKTEHLNSYLSKLNPNLNLSIEEMLMLGRNIFEGLVDGKVKQSIYKRDVFFDAVISKPNSGDKFLEKDAITPHGDNPLKNPIPITFMKIAAGVVLQFNFLLHDFNVGTKIVDVNTKKFLFESLLCDFGIGAKTNVGYGQFKRK